MRGSKSFGSSETLVSGFQLRMLSRRVKPSEKNSILFHHTSPLADKKGIYSDARKRGLIRSDARERQVCHFLISSGSMEPLAFKGG